MIACCFKAVTYASSDGATSDELRALMTILARSLPKGSKLSYMATYEGIQIFFADFMARSRPEVDSAVMAFKFSAESMEFVRGMAALLLPVSANEKGRFLPLPENSNTEAVRTARARAVFTYASCGLQDAQEKETASMAVTTWLNSERSGPVRDILHEAHAFLLKQGERRA